MPNPKRIGNGAVFQDDNSRPHRAIGVQDYIRQHGIQMMDWPARSPDMNPIEHLWDLLDRRVRGRQQVPQTVAELRQALIDEWCNIPKVDITNLVNSMRRRCTELLRENGRHTHYLYPFMLCQCSFEMDVRTCGLFEMRLPLFKLTPRDELF